MLVLVAPLPLPLAQLQRGGKHHLCHCLELSQDTDGSWDIAGLLSSKMETEVELSHWTANQEHDLCRNRMAEWLLGCVILFSSDKDKIITHS